ncbi:MAG: PAS domain S-box protein [Acetobacterium sp.]|nr:PAS domain S-box protein [Acetobacterium sp.]
MKSYLNRWLVVAILIILVAGTAASLWTAAREDQQMREQLLTQARLAYVGINAGQVAALSGSDADLFSTEYLSLKNQMTGFRAADPDVRFAYLIGRRADSAYFFFVDSEPPESEDYSPPGQEYPEVTVLIKKVFTTGTPLIEGPDSDRWGTWVSSIVPVADPKTGNTIAIFGMDVDARNWNWQIFVACLPPITGTFLILVMVLTFFSIQQRNERERYQTLLFLRTQQALVQMTKLSSDTLDAFLHPLTKIDAETIGVDRVSVWWFSDDLSELVCSECYDRLSNTHTNGMRLKRSDYPRYFTALAENRIIAVEDARHDERTEEFIESYLIPLNIMSMLDVPIRRGGQIVGIVCREHTGQTRIWDPHEQDFAASVADLISSALERAERKTIEEALFESERRYRGVVEDQTELISRFRPDGTYVFVNDAYCRFFSVERDHIVGKKFSPVIPPDDQILIGKHLPSLTKDAPVAEITHRIILPDGQVRWLRWIDRAIFNEQGEVVEYQSVGRDISWQKQVEETLSRANQKLSLLSSITCHDVLNQLLVLNGYLQLSNEFVHDPEKTHDYLERAIKAVTTIEAQINFTRTYQDMGSIAPSWQNVNTCIIRAIGGLPMVDIRTELHRPNLEVLADPLLEKVFYNLFDNAIRYGGEQMKMIRVSSAETLDGLVIVCEDDGAGIAESDKDRLFTQGFGKNTGFGLFLSREILAISGITIRETSLPGKGARFEITVPRGSFRFSKSG